METKSTVTENARPLAEMIGSGAGLYESPDEVDREIRNQREAWDD